MGEYWENLKGEDAEGCRVSPTLHAWGYREYLCHCHGNIRGEPIVGK
ncbi:hypothetical protein Y592_00925 [Thermosipho sp. 1070]|nr:hypothetical protein Y592_00925 [Thermosipho sp. 1070]